MKQRILTAIAALLCTLTLLSAGIAPVHAYAPPSNEGGVSTQAEEFRWYYRDNLITGAHEMRLWSITKLEWVTDWIPVPDGWPYP